MGTSEMHQVTHTPGLLQRPEGERNGMQPFHTRGAGAPAHNGSPVTECTIADAMPR